MAVRVEKTREGAINPWDILASRYPGFAISDAALFSFRRNIHVGFAGLAKPAPILRGLFAHERVSSFIARLPKGTVALFAKGREGISFWIDGRRKTLPPEVAEAAWQEAERCSAYGGFIDKKGNLALDLKAPAVGPHYGANLLLGWREGCHEPLLTTPKSVVDEFGRGSFRAQAAYQVLATRWDIRPEENGNPFNRQFYLFEDGRQIFCSSFLSEEVEAASCRHCPNKTVIAYELKDGLSIERTIFLLAQLEGLPEATEVQMVRLRSPRKRRLTIVFTGMFGFSNPDCMQTDVLYQTIITQSEALIENGHLLALSPDYYPAYFKGLPRFVSLVGDNGFADGFSNDATSFLGGGSIEAPRGASHLDNAFLRKGASFFALSKDFELRPNVTYAVSTFTGMADAEAEGRDKDDILTEKVTRLLKRFPDESALDAQLAKQDKAFARHASFFQIGSGSRLFREMADRHLPFQTLYQTFVSRSFAQTQKGYREIGFREVQDLYATLPYLLAEGKKPLAEELLGKWIGNVHRMGYANHNFYFSGKEPGMCSDDQLWLLPAIATFVRWSGDSSILLRSFPMADGGERPLIGTIEAIITYSGQISVGKHGLPLLDRSDWNDTLQIDADWLDGPAKEKAYREQLQAKGLAYGAPLESDLSESVMNAFLLIVALEETSWLAHSIGRADLAAKAASLKEAMTSNVRRSAYINGYYARVLINRPHPLNGLSFVGAPGDGLSSDKGLADGSLYLNSLSWSLLSGVASESEIASMLSLADGYLRTPFGYKLCSECDLVRVGTKASASSHYFPGDRENGGVFKHAAMMFALALLKAAKRDYDPRLKQVLADDAFFMMRLAYPYKTLRNPYFLKGNPRFCTQYANSVTGENIGPILSGTATWLTLCLEEAAGFALTPEGLSLRPLLPKDKGLFRYRLRLPAATYSITIRQKKGHCGMRLTHLSVDGTEMDPAGAIQLFKDGEIHRVLAEAE